MTVTTTSPGVYVAPPAVEPRPYGLFSTVTWAPPAEGSRWELGTHWEPHHCGPAQIAALDCPPPDEYTPGWPLEPVDGVDRGEASAFLVLGSYGCSAPSRSTADAEDRALQSLYAGEERAVEWALASGLLGNSPSFQGADDVTPTPGTAVGIRRAIGLLESELGKGHHSLGVIHAPLLASGLIEQVTRVSGQRLVTTAGNMVALGAGYDLAGVGPTGTAPGAGTAWMYATGRPRGWRSDVHITDPVAALNKDDNALTIYAQRTYVVGWDCVTAAVLVSLDD